MVTGRNYKFWFCTGSQDLYGDECLRKVAEHSRIIVEELNKSDVLPFELVWKPTLITNELIRKTFNEANADEECAGVITWMHTFSPAKSWILGLKEYRKPLCHLHTQFNQEIPYDTIDMDFMNENQSAHGGREYGHIVTRMGIERKVIVGHWADKKVQERLASWMRTAVGIMESSHIRVCRVADNMRNVAVTEGDKVEAQMKEEGIRCSVDRPGLKTLFCSRLNRLSLPRLRFHRTLLYQGTRRKRPQRSRTPHRSRYSGYPGCPLHPLSSGISRPLRPQPHCRLTGEAQYIPYQPPRRS